MYIYVIYMSMYNIYLLLYRWDFKEKPENTCIQNALHYCCANKFEENLLLKSFLSRRAQIKPIIKSFLYPFHLDAE